MLAQSNIILIGMPGSGKSTIGRRLAKHYGLCFVDGDVLIEHAAGMNIQSVVNRMGLRRFAEIEERVLSGLELRNSVISTGGSAVYSARAMESLGRLGRRLYLNISRATLMQRVDNVASRGLYKLPAHHLLRLYADREALYPKYADITFTNNSPFTAAKADQLYQLLDSYG